MSAIIRWMCQIKVSDKIASDGLLEGLGLKNLETVLQINRFPTGIYMFKVNNERTRTSLEICSKLTIKTSE